MALTFTQLASDPLNGANRNPINPAVWTDFPTYPDSQILNNVCVTSSAADLFSGCYYSGITFPGNQYMQVTGHFNDAQADIAFFLRDDLQGNSYYAQVCPSSSPVAGGGFSFLLGMVHSGIGFVPVVQNNNHTFASGDVYLFAVQGNTLYFYQNGVLIEQGAADNSRISGVVGFQLDDNTAITDAGITLFSAGSVASVGPPTLGVVGPLGVLNSFSSSPSYFVNAVSNPSGSDVLQVINEGGKVVWNLDKNGNANVNPVSPTFGALNTVFGSSFIQAFAPNPYNLDVLQVVSPGGKVVFSVDYQGNAGTH